MAHKRVRFVRTTERGVKVARVDSETLRLDGEPVALTDGQIERLQALPGCTFEVGDSDGLEDLTREQLNELAAGKVEDPEGYPNKPELIEAIRSANHNEED